MKAIILSNYKRKLIDVLRDLYRERGWEMPKGFADTIKRDPNTHSRQEAGQAKRAKLDAKAQKAMFRRCWEHSDGRTAFAAALWSDGYALAQGYRRGFVAVDADGKIWSLSRWCGVKPKDLRARLGSEDFLCTVTEAYEAFGGVEAPSPRKVTRKEGPANETGLAEVIARQRSERRDLEIAQEKRRTAELRDLQVRGLRALWMRMTGAYQAHVDHCASMAETTQRRDRDELQTLIWRHLRERRALDHQRQHPGAWVDALTDVFEQIPRSDPRQRLVLPRDDMPFTRDQLLKNPELILDHISYT